jgi:hypothetical protein
MRSNFLSQRPSLIPASASRALEYIWLLAPHGFRPAGARQLRLWRAIEAHDPPSVEAALLDGADPSCRATIHGRAHHPIGAAIQARWLGGHDGLRCLELLLLAGASPDTRLLDRADQDEVSQQARHGEPCLIRALRLGDMLSCAMLLEHGANPDAVWAWTSAQSSEPLSARSLAWALSPSCPSKTSALFLHELARRESHAEARELLAAMDPPSLESPLVQPYPEDHSTRRL